MEIYGKETLRKGGNDIENALELMQARKKEVLDLDGAQQIDEELGQLISKNYKDGLNADGKKLLDIQDAFRHLSPCKFYPFCISHILYKV